MKTVEECMDPHPATASPLWSVERAAETMDRLHVRYLAVMGESGLVGVLTDRNLRLSHPNRLVADVMTRDVPRVPPESSLWDARQMLRNGHEYLAVVRGGLLLGLIGRDRIELELARYACPLTDLPRGEILKSRAEELIARGHEVAVIFLDLDDFREVNKQHGHVVGDHVLREIGELLRSLVSAETDILGRYGGDEFVVVTTRPLVEAEMLADSLVQAMARRTYGPEGIPLKATAGVAGGRRQGPRREADPGWTVDDLFNLASLASTRAKKAGVSVALAAGHLTPAAERAAAP